jgi:hypothetical protein
VLGVLLVAMAQLLTGCVPVSNLSATIDGSDVSFGICETMTVEAIRVTMVDKQSHEATDLWAVEGSVQLDKGLIVVMGEQLPGTKTTISLRRPELADHYIDIHLESTNSRGEQRIFFGHFDGDRLSSDQWLRNDGGVGDHPC